MKKIVCFVLAIAVLALSFCSCGKTNISLDGKQFMFYYAQNELDVETCSERVSELYPNAKLAEYTLKAENGTLTLVGEEGEYSGTYTVYEVLKDYVLYKITLGKSEGFASLKELSYSDGSKEYTLLITIKGYTASFSTGILSE